MIEADTERVVAYCRGNLPLATAKLGMEFGYPCLVLCVIDTVFSPGVRYESVTNTIWRYCRYLGTTVDACTVTLDELLRDMERLGIEAYAERVFKNRQRTSPRGGILKAEAVYRFAGALGRQGLSTVEDVRSRWPDPAAECEIRAIPGHGSGVSLKYFLMTCRAYNSIIPDRMIFRFLEQCLARSVSSAEAEHLLTGACRQLQADFPHLTPALLDNQIWKFQRDRQP